MTEREILFEKKIDQLLLLKALLISRGEFHGKARETINKCEMQHLNYYI